MNKVLELISVSEYSHIPLKAIETWLTAYPANPIPELDDIPSQMSPSERLSAEIYPHQDEIELYGKKVHALYPNYYEGLTLKPTLLDFSKCAEHQLDEALDRRDSIVIYNVVPSEFARYLDASGVGKLVARWWQILPPDSQVCDRAIGLLKCLQERNIKFQFLLPQFIPMYFDWAKLLRGLHKDSIDFINNTGQNIEQFPILNVDRLQYTRKDGAKVDSIASTYCRSASPSLKKSLEDVMGIFREIKSSSSKCGTYSGMSMFGRSGIQQTYPEEIELPEALKKTLVGRREVYQNCEIFQFLGILDAFSEPAFRKVLDKCIDDGAIDIVLDLSNIDFVDSSGLGALVQVVKKAQSVKGTVQIVTSVAVAGIINRLHLQEFLTMRVSVAAAIASLS